LVIDQRIEQELFSHVLEEVLLSPAIEHTVGDLDIAEVPSIRDHLRLVTVVAQARDLSQAQPAFEESHRLIMQDIIHPAPVEFGATPDEPPLVDTPTPTLAIGEHVEPVVDHPAEQLCAPAAAVEHHGDPLPADQAAYFAEQPGQGLGQRSTHLSGNHE
jgi:hypothetical protein